VTQRRWTFEDRRALIAMARRRLAHATIARRLGRSVAAVKAQIGLLRRLGLLPPAGDIRGTGRAWTAAEDAWLIAQVEAGVAIPRLVAGAGRSARALRHRAARLRAAGLICRPKGKTGPKGVNWAPLPALWACERISMARIATQVGVTRSAVRLAALALGLPPRARPHACKVRVDEALLAEMWAFGVSPGEIARAMGVSRSTITARRVALGLPARRRDRGGQGGWGGQTAAAFAEWKLGQKMRQAA